MKSKLIFTLGALFLFLICGQESFAQPKGKKKKGVEEEKISPKFSYSPETRESVASTGITIALLNPVFTNRDLRGAGSPWSDFAKAMSSDIEELLISKGFKVRGPFSSIDDMVVSDKTNSDFILKISMDIEPKLQRKLKQIYVMNLVGPSTYQYQVTQGDGSIGGKVQLTASSCFSNEKLWKKDLDISQKTFSYTGTVKWPTSTINPGAELQQDVNLWNPVCKILEEMYKESFDIFYKQFAKEEMAPVAEESRKTDKDKRGD